MFVPQNVEIKDSIILYSNNGDSIKFLVSKKEYEISPKEEFTSNCKCTCYDRFELEFRNYTYPKLDKSEINNINDIRYIFEFGGYRSEKEAINSPVHVTISIGTFNHSFSYYTVKEYDVVNSKYIDSLIINNICYYDVLELKNSEESIHVAKDFGVVQIEMIDGEIWTLNEWKNQ